MDIQFYPTPGPIALRAWAKFKNKNFVRILEPSAGEGHLARKRPDHDTDRWHAPPPPVDCIEIDVTKHPLLREQGFDVIGVDFLQFDGSASIYSHILLNPPFENGAKHVLKAWDLMFDAELVAILNAETIRNPYSKEREHLVRLIAQHGEVEFIEGAFAMEDAERKTDVEIALVYLKKESNFSVDLVGDIMDGLKKDGPHIGLDAGFEEANELAIPANFIENSVLIFQAAVKAMRESVFAQARESKYASRLGMNLEEMNAEKPEGSSDKVESSLEGVRRELHKRHADFKARAWSGILRSTEVLSRLSSGAQKRVESEFETIKTLEFSVSNIYGFLGGLIAKQGELQIGMCCDVFDAISKYHLENRSHFMGWSSNSKHRTLGMKIKTSRFILPGFKVESWNRGLSWEAMQQLRDFDKVFALLDGRQNPPVGLADIAQTHFEELKSGKRVSSTYYDARLYPGIGTMHFFARDKKLVDRLNKLVGRHRKWLAPAGERVSEAFWLQYDKADEFSKEIEAEARKGCRNGWDDPFWRAMRGDDSERALGLDKVTNAIATVLEKHGIDPNALLEAPEPPTELPQLPLLAAA